MVALKDLYWLAGMVEGEGTFYLAFRRRGNKKIYYPEMNIQTTDYDVALRIASIMDYRLSAVKPYNYSIGTHELNMSDQPAKGEHYWTKQTTCPKGHPLDGKTRPYLAVRGTVHRYCKTCARIRMRNRRKEMRKTT